LKPTWRFSWLKRIPDTDISIPVSGADGLGQLRRISHLYLKISVCRNKEPHLCNILILFSEGLRSVENTKAGQCRYVYRNREQCKHPADTQGLCFWHNPEADKTGSDVKTRLEKLVLEGNSLEGFKLAQADLEGVNLVRQGAHGKTCLAEVDFYRANLKHAHCFNVNLSGGSLMKSDLSGANCNLADLSGVNLLGTKFDRTKLENVQWGDRLIQEEQALEHHRRKDRIKSQRLFKEAEEIYRHLQRACEDVGLFDNAGIFFQKAMTMRRFQAPLWSARRLISKFVDLSCGYGENSARVILFALSLIFSFAVLYFTFGIKGPEHPIRLNPDLSFFPNLAIFLEALYFSVVTFTTLGYGDISPIGITRVFATVEAFLGSFSLAFFVVVFVKKMTR
jgi:hypothetical protein